MCQNRKEAIIVKLVEKSSLSFGIKEVLGDGRGWRILINQKEPVMCKGP